MLPNAIAASSGALFNKEQKTGKKFFENNFCNQMVAHIFAIEWLQMLLSDDALQYQRHSISICREATIPCIAIQKI